MKTYHICTSVQEIKGTQVWAVQADSPAAALDKFNNEGGEFVAEEMEVESLAEPTLEDVHEIPEYKHVINVDKKGDRHLITENFYTDQIKLVTPTPPPPLFAELDKIPNETEVERARADKAEKELLDLRQENARLKRWRDEQFLVESQWNPQELAKLLGMTLGMDIRPNIKPAVLALIAQINGLKEELAEKDKILGTRLIFNERLRQLKAHGYDAAHDDQHVDGELMMAAICYLDELARRRIINIIEQYPPSSWPFENRFWKPKADPIRQLAVVGAFIAAEIDRLNRLSK